jgi:hypothetical protein
MSKLPKTPIKKEAIVQYWMESLLSPRMMILITTAATEAAMVRKANNLLRIVGLLSCILL